MKTRSKKRRKEGRALFVGMLLLLVGMFSCSEDRPQIPANKLPKSTVEEDLLEMNKGFVEIEKSDIRHYVDSLGLKMDSTGTGLRYHVTKMGSGDTVAANATVTIRYSVTMLDGMGCDNLQNVTKTFTLGSGGSIRGIEEAVSLLSVSGEGEFIMPSYLAYGVAGYKDCVAPWSPIFCKIYLIESK
ncbi:MAG: FKBP-type peptidyl-prolyl cis-trans isomerase [Paludibacteraceae bacterium]|nr:FKBP-type peptidyl-prolyl cis-trans isomerase [Prevotellaceae bacterium]